MDKCRSDQLNAPYILIAAYVDRSTLPYTVCSGKPYRFDTYHSIEKLTPGIDDAHEGINQVQGVLDSLGVEM